MRRRALFDFGKYLHQGHFKCRNHILHLRSLNPFTRLDLFSSSSCVLRSNMRFHIQNTLATNCHSKEIGICSLFTEWRKCAGLVFKSSSLFSGWIAEQDQESEKYGNQDMKVEFQEYELHFVTILKFMKKWCHEKSNCNCLSRTKFYVSTNSFLIYLCFGLFVLVEVISGQKNIIPVSDSLQNLVCFPFFQ